MTRWNLGPLLAPRSIAIVGASESPDSWAPEIERSLRHVGFEGELFPVNPKYAEVWGRPCRASVGELPRGVDLAVIVVPARVAVRMVDECGAAGVRSVMVVSSGFAEAGEEGRALQEELRADGHASSAARARSQRRGVRELRRARRPLRDDASAGTGRRFDQRHLAIGDGGLGHEPARVGPRRRLADHPGRGERGGARTRRPLRVGGRRSTHEGGLHLHRDDARRGRDRPRTGRAPRRAQAGPGLCPGRAERGGPPIDRGAYRRAGGQHGASRCLAPRARRDPRRGSGDDVRGGGAAVVRHADANDRRRGGAAVRRGVHPVRRGGRREGPGAARVLGAPPGAACGRRCRTSRRRTTRST